MPRLPDPDSPEVRETFRKVEESRGFVSNLLRSLGHAPEGLQRFQQLGGYVRFETALTEMQKELAICITGRNIPYAAAHHFPLVLAAGVTEAQLDTIRAGKTPSDLGPAERALCDYVFAHTSFAGVPDAVLAELLRHYSPRSVTDIALTAAFFLAAGSLIIANEVTIEPPAMIAAEVKWQRQVMAARARP